MVTHLKATERRLPYGITLLLPATPHRQMCSTLTLSKQASIRFTNPRGMKAELTSVVGYIPSLPVHSVGGSRSWKSMASMVVRAYSQGLGAEPPVGSRDQGVSGGKPT